MHCEKRPLFIVHFAFHTAFSAFRQLTCPELKQSRLILHMITLSRVTFILLTLSLITSCGRPNSSALLRKSPSQSEKRRIVHPPQSFIDAVFDYRKNNIDWPQPLDNVTRKPGVKADLDAFMTRGMEYISYAYSSRDTLILEFNFSRTKEADYYGFRGSPPPLRDIPGQYIFIRDSSLMLFKVELTKPKLFEVKIN